MSEINKITLLYKSIMQNQQHHARGWHKSFKSFVDEVNRVKEKLDTENSAIEVLKENEDFLKKLLYEKSNGVASKGQSTLSKENFNKILKDDSFLEALKMLMLDTTAENLKNFNTKWKDIVGNNNPVLTNRVAAACNTKLSTTVNEPDFNETLNWLKANGYVDDISGGNWFEKNTSLIEFFHNNIDDLYCKNYNIEYDEFWISMFVWLVHENMSNPFKLKKQVVKYGAPGTGKTFKAKEVAHLQFDVWKSFFGQDTNFSSHECTETVQFHPSYTYEDFMEGLRPMPDSEGQSQLKLQNGIFKKLCIAAGKWEIDLFPYRDELFKEKKTFNQLTVQDLEPLEDKLKGEYWKYIFLLDKQVKLEKALPPYFIIIDEINRAELSRVFGELMYSLEYRGVEGRIKTQYAQLNTKDTGMLEVDNGFQFFVPHNVYVLATMNTIDRSVDSFDFALRRRFRWEEVRPSKTLLAYHLAEYNDKWKDLPNAMQKLNEAIEKEPLLGRDYCIGHAYFWNLPYDKSLELKEVKKLIWKDSLQALLLEYLRGTGKEAELIKDFKKAFEE